MYDCMKRDGWTKENNGYGYLGWGMTGSVGINNLGYGLREESLCQMNPHYQKIPRGWEEDSQ